VADLGPQLVALDPLHAEPDHHAVVQLGAAPTDAERQPGDRLWAVAASTVTVSDGPTCYDGAESQVRTDVSGMYGYREIRPKDELRRLLEACVSPEFLPWTTRFPDEFYKELFRLRGWTYGPAVSQTTQARWVSDGEYCLQAIAGRRSRRT
jgi:P63C domain-containing protein